MDTVPGTVSRYSGGGFVVLPQLMIDAAAAYRADGQPLGLFAVELQKSHAGKSNRVLGAAMTKQMLTPRIAHRAIAAS